MMQQAIKILEDILEVTTMDKYYSGAECMAARNILNKAIGALTAAEKLKTEDTEYFKHQKQLLERE